MPPGLCPAPGRARCRGGMGGDRGTPPLSQLPPRSLAVGPGRPTRCQRISWSSAINNLGAPGASGAWETQLEGWGSGGGPWGAPTSGVAVPKAAKWVQDLGGIPWLPRLGLCPRPPLGLGVHSGCQDGPTRMLSPTSPTPRHGRGCPRGEVQGGFSLPDTPVPCLSSWPGNGASPSVFFHAWGSGHAPPGQENTAARHGDAKPRSAGDQGGGRTPKPPKAPRFNTRTEPKAPLARSPLNAGGAAAGGHPPLAAPLTCQRRSP